MSTTRSLPLMRHDAISARTASTAPWRQRLIARGEGGRQWWSPHDVDPQQPTTLDRPGRWLAWFVLTIVPFLVGFGAPQVVDNVYTPSLRVRAGDGAAWLAAHTGPPLAAKAYLLYDLDADRVLLTHQASVALPPASLTKLMTALLVLEKGELQALVTVQSSDLVGGTAMGLRAGEQRTVEELLWGMLIPSGNDAATALARHLGGTVAAFVTQMNERAVALGLAQTVFANPHGLDAEGHVSSAADLLILARQVWDYPLFRQIVATASTTIGGHALRNTNELLESDPRVNGIKTGTTDAAGQCLIAGIQDNGRQIIGIVLGSSDRYTDMRALDRYYQATYQWIDVQRDALTVLDRIQDETGKTWYLRTGGPPVTFLAPKFERERLQVYRRLQLPTTGSWVPGLAAGTLEWRMGDQVVGTQLLFFW